MKVSNWTALAVCGLLAGVVATEGAAAVVDNKWQGGSGKWSENAHWSLGEPPTADQRAYFPDSDDITVEVDKDVTCECFCLEKRSKTGESKVTLTGSHTITTTSSQASSPQILQKRCLVLDGASITLSNQKNFQNYGGLILKTGSVLTITRHAQLYGDGAYITVDGGDYHNTGQQSYYVNSRITVNSGVFYQNSANGIFPNAADSSYNLTFTVNGGTVTTKGLQLANGSRLTLNGGEMTVTASKITQNGQPAPDTVTHAIMLDATSALAVSGGKLTVSKEPEVEDGATLALTGGELFMNGVTLKGRRWIDASTGTMIGATILEPFTENEEKIIAKCPLKATDHLLADMTNVSLVCTETSFVRQLRNGVGLNPTYSFPRLVMGGLNWATAADGNNRTFFVEGPLEIRATANMAVQSSKNIYPRVTGDVTVDTRDWNDPTVQRKICLDGFGTYGGATLTVRGGGECVVKQSYSQASFTRVSVEEGTTLTLMEKTMSSDAGFLRTTAFELGENAVLSIPACGLNGVYAANWTIDPTARINVTVKGDFESGVLPILVDMGGTGVPSNILGQVVVTGLPEGATVGVFAGSLYAVKSTGLEPDGKYDYEWTGNGANRNFSNAENWHPTGTPVESKVYAFGACDTYTEPYFDYVNTTEGKKGYTLGQLLFRDTAVKPFTIGGGATITLSKNAEPTKWDFADVSVLSKSPMAQVVSRPLRSTRHLAVFSWDLGSVTLNGGFTMATSSKNMYFCGDVRIGGSVTTKWPTFTLLSGASMPMGTSFAVLPGTTVTFTNQNQSFAAPNASFRVCETAKLVLDGVSRSYFYRWTSKPSPHVIDGQMDVNVEFRGGADQSYVGKGTLNLAAVTPYGSASSAVRFADTLTVNLSAPTWPTLAKDAGATVLSMQAAGNPTLHVPAGWTYGPAADADPTLSSPENRALVLQAQGTLTLDADGGTATFADPIAGRGTLAMANGTLRLNAPSDAELAGVSVASGSSLEINAAQRLGSISLAAGTSAKINADVTLGNLSADGATLKFASGAKVSAPDGLDVDGVVFDLSDPSFAEASWKTLVASAGAITGTPVLPSGWKSRIRTVDGVNLLETRPETGMTLLVR